MYPESISVETHSHPRGGFGRKYAGSSDAGLFAEKATGMVVLVTVLTTGLLVARKLLDREVDVEAAVAAGTIEDVTSIASMAARTISTGLRGRALLWRCQVALSVWWYRVEK